MENKQIALSDVERNKELFEYEMTEVILQLKGEFAKISGKDMKLKDARMEVPNLKINTELPTVDTVSLGVQVPVVVNGNVTAIPTVTFEKTNVNRPTVPAVCVSLPKKVILDQIQLDCPTANAHVNVNNTCVNIEFPTISQVETKLDISSHIEFVAMDKNWNSNIVIDLPKTDINVKSDICTSISGVSIEVPYIPATAQYTGTKVVIENTMCDIKDDVRAIPEYSYQDINVEDFCIDVTKVPAISSIDIKKVALADTPINIPTIPKVNVDLPKKVSTTQETISLPIIKSMKIPMPLQVTKSHFDLNDTVVPVINICSGTDTSISVEKPNINCEYSAVRSVSLSDVVVQNKFGIDVPEIPDFSDAIKEVLESAV